MTRLGFRDRLATYLLDRPDVWLSAAQLARIGGSCGWRARISELRQRGFSIACNKSWNRKLKAVVTSYRYSPVRRTKAA